MRHLFEVLGPLRINHLDEAVVLPSSKPTMLLGALLLHANSTVSQEYLRRVLWGDEPPATGASAIHATMLRLRRLLEKYRLNGAGGSGIETVPGGYRILADATTLDMLAFRDTVRRAGECDSAETELGLLRRALAHWRGAPVAGVGSAVLRTSAVAALIEERINALARCHEIELARGNCAAIVPELRALTAEYAGDERLTAQLMEALYRSGRQSEALSEYQSVRRYLRENFGIDPGPELQRIHLAIVKGEEWSPRTRAGATPRETVAPVERAVVRPPVPPPAEPADFCGRTTELAELTGLLTGEQTRTVIVSGLPGVGKTALALRLARRLGADLPGGWHFLDAADAARTGVPALPERSLVVLDRVTSSDQALPALDALTGHRVLVTSRHSLADLAVSRGAGVFRLRPFRRAESLRFLAGTLGERMTTADPEAADELAALCGDHPIALRLIATRLLLRPGQDLGAALDRARSSSLAELTVGGPHGTSAARAFDDYLATLPADAVPALRRLAEARADSLTFAECADLLGAPADELQALLDQLIEASALDYWPGGRYRMHGLLRGHLCGALRPRDPAVATAPAP
ncbi:AfsR/SARP family transcriptional regulator [Streptomyces sp. NPDC007205]|uniref:AfsR/SARP family transcriptional regulator n=1 Tax=Streptomyces sp. NPDC007205 TaxID=3154316 RepID=UPI00340E2290